MARAKTQRGYTRFAKRPTAVPAHIDPEETPPPMSPEPDRLPGADSIPPPILDQLRMLHGSHRALAEQLWPGRHLAEQIESLDRKLDGFTQSMVLAEATAQGAWDAVKELMPRLDQLLQGQGRAAAVADTVSAISGKLDAFAERFAAIERKQGEAAVRFEEHDKRDQEIEATVGRIETRVDALEQRNHEQDAGDKRELALARRRRRLLAGLIGAVSTGVGWLAGFFT